MSFGRPYILRTSGCIHDGWLVLSGDDKIVDQDYFYHLLGSDSTYRKFKSLAAGAVVKNLNIDLVKTVKVPLPPLAEQRRIAAILDKADALRAKRREAIAKLDQLLQSVFLDMFGDPVTNPKGWPIESLKQLGKVQTGSTPPSSETGMFDGDIPFVTPGDLVGVIVNTKRNVTAKGAAKIRVASAGSTLVCCIGTIGKMGLATKESSFNQQINAVTWGANIQAEYGFHTMTFFAKEIANRGTSTTLPILKKSEFEKIAIPVASKLLQTTFKKFVEKHSSEKMKMALSVTKTEAIFASLQRQAFAGTL